MLLSPITAGGRIEKEREGTVEEREGKEREKGGRERKRRESFRR